jgi:hypothetical protein
MLPKMSVGFVVLSAGWAAAAPAVVLDYLNLRYAPGYDQYIIEVIPPGWVVNTRRLRRRMVSSQRQRCSRICRLRLPRRLGAWVLAVVRLRLLLDLSELCLLRWVRRRSVCRPLRRHLRAGERR